MANFRIWAPWRLAYVKDAWKDQEEECIFCAKPAQDDDVENLIVHRGEHSFVILNLFPYTNGHLMVIRGFTPSGDVIVNDPASRLIASDAAVENVFDRQQFADLDDPARGRRNVPLVDRQRSE